jgi:hypothetical protein
MRAMADDAHSTPARLEPAPKRAYDRYRGARPGYLDVRTSRRHHEVFRARYRGGSLAAATDALAGQMASANEGGAEAWH